MCKEIVQTDKMMELHCEPTLNISCFPCWIIVECWFYTYNDLEGYLSETSVKIGYSLLSCKDQISQIWSNLPKGLNLGDS